MSDSSKQALVTPRAFWAAFYPFLISFMISRLLLQTDLVMVSRLGEAATAAFALPVRVMFLDIVVAFAFAPVISVMVGGARDESEKSMIIRSALVIAAISGVLITAAGLALYPWILSLVTPDRAVLLLGKQAVFWLTIAITPRLVQFAASMAIHGDGKGRFVVPMNATLFVLNAIFDWLFIFHLGMGFAGSYIGTLICSFLGMVWSLWLLRRHLRGGVTHLQSKKWVSAFLSGSTAEFGRLISERGAALAVLYVFAQGESTTPRLGAFAAASELQNLLFMPGIAAMRATAVVAAPLAASSKKELYRSLSSVAAAGLLVAFSLGALAMATSSVSGHALYGLSEEGMRWWRPFCALLCIWLPLKFVDCLQRGVWQANKQLWNLFAADAGSAWLIMLPLLVLAMRHAEPWAVWGAVFAGDCAAATFLYIRAHAD